MSQCEIVGKDLLIEFLEVAFNNILYARKLYPAETFVTKKMYSTAVYVSQHPELNEYIGNVLKTLRQWLTMDTSGVSAINVKFFDKDEQLVEKYVFNLIDVGNGNTFQNFEKDPYFTKIEQLLRSLSLGLSKTMSYLTPLPEESTFSIDVEARQWAHVALCESSMAQEFAWILSPGSNAGSLSCNNRSNQDSELIRRSSLLPLIDVKSCGLRLELFVVETK